MQLSIHNHIFNQKKYESNLLKSHQKANGIFLTNDLHIIDRIFESIAFDETLLDKKIFEPSCGHGVFVIQFLINFYHKFPSKDKLYNFIENNIYFNDIDQQMLDMTIKNIKELYLTLIGEVYQGSFNSFHLDFTQKYDQESLFSENSAFITLYNQIDYIIGNPPYISLYGRRDQKRNEEQRVYYLQTYKQFPKSLKNGKINYIMLFIEHSLELLQEGGQLTFIIDLSFFETAFEHTRKFLIQNHTIKKIIYNIEAFESVGSGQIILEVQKGFRNNHHIELFDYKTKKNSFTQQSKWDNPYDEYKIRLEDSCEVSSQLLNKIYDKGDPTLKSLYPKKNLRTCMMLLNYEKEFIYPKQENAQMFAYYQGSKSIKYKYSLPTYQQYIYYDKELQNSINDRLKIELTQKGIKNKKRIGLGEIEIYQNPKVYIRQSAKEIIATYDESPSSANNSLYVFTLRDDSQTSRDFLKFITGLLNSTLMTFFAQKRRIIRYNQGKQPQIKTSDLYQILIPKDQELQNTISLLVEKIYNNPIKSESFKKEIDDLLYQYYGIDETEKVFIEQAIVEYLQ